MQNLLIPQKDYIETVVWHWHDTRKLGEPLLIYKTRRLIVSWVLCGLELHDLGIQRANHIIADETYDKSQAHVWRHHHLYEQLRAKSAGWGLPEHSPYGAIGRRMASSVVLPNGSIIDAHNSNSASFQGAGVRGVRLEELGTYKSQMAEMLSQAMMITKGSPGQTDGHVVPVTNMVTNEEFLDFVEKDDERPFLVVRTFDKLGDEAVVVPEPKALGGSDENDIYISKTDLRTVKIHYTADPEKRSEEWLQHAKKGVPIKQWNRENEFIAALNEGEPVWDEEFKRWKHVWPKGEKWTIDWKSELFICLDGGVSVNPSALLLELSAAAPQERQLVAVQEWAPMKAMGAPKLMEWILNWLRTTLPGRWDSIRWVGDQTITSRQGATGKSFQQLVRDEFGIQIHPKPNAKPQRMEAVRTILNDWIDEDTPRFVVVEDGCPTLVKGFEGRYCYRKARPGDYEDLDDPLKNAFSHGQDAFQYGCLEVLPLIYGKAKSGRNSR